MNAGTCWEQEYNRPNGLSVEKAPKSDLYLYLLRHMNVKSLQVAPSIQNFQPVPFTYSIRLKYT